MRKWFKKTPNCHLIESAVDSKSDFTLHSDKKARAEEA